MTRIEYGNNRDIENIHFEDGWVARLYIDATPKAADVKYITDVETKNGIDITKSRVVQEQHILRFICSETMVKVLQKLPLMSNVKIKVDNFEENKVYNVSFDVTNWIGPGAYAQCKLTYVIKNFVNKNASIISYD